MKKLLILSAILFIFYASNAQWSTLGTNIYNTNTGNVGIRMNNPIYPFQVFDGGTNQYSGISLIPGTSSTGDNATIKTLKAGGYGLILRAESDNSMYGQAAIYIQSANGSTIPSQVTTMSYSIDLRTGVGFTDNITGKTFGTSALFINSSQQVGIGTQSPGSFKLAVEGKIGAREIKVTATNPFPDYVFNKTYKLRPLFSLEDFIKRNNHLPGVPSAQEVQDNNGIELGQMNIKLLEKIEELTLYVIELKKENEQIKKDIKQLKRGNGTSK